MEFDNDKRDMRFYKKMIELEKNNALIGLSVDNARKIFRDTFGKEIYILPTSYQLDNGIKYLYEYESEKYGKIFCDFRTYTRYTEEHINVTIELVVDDNDIIIPDSEFHF